MDTDTTKAEVFIVVIAVEKEGDLFSVDWSFWLRVVLRVDTDLRTNK